MFRLAAVLQRFATEGEYAVNRLDRSCRCGALDRVGIECVQRPESIAVLAPRCVSLAQLGSHEVADEVMPASSACALLPHHASNLRNSWPPASVVARLTKGLSSRIARVSAEQTDLCGAPVWPSREAHSALSARCARLRSLVIRRGRQ